MTPASSSGFRAPVRDDLVGEHAYGAPVLDVPVRLNVNENPYPPSETLTRALADAVADVASGLNRYPDRDAVALREALAGYLGHGLTVDRVWAANGSNEVMAQLFSAFAGPGRSSLTFTPTYSMYPQYARDSFTEHIEIAMPADYRLAPDHVEAEVERNRPDLVLLASPNNPTGIAVPAEVVEAALRALDRHRTGLVVVDEAYAEFRRRDTGSALELLAEHPRLVVTRTMSKAFAFAGARVGYLAAHPAVVEAVQLVRLPYHLSAVTQAVATTAVGFAGELLGHVEVLRAERDALAGWLADIGLHVFDSDANFLLTGPFTDRHAVWQHLVDRGVLVRETGPAGYLRITVGTPSENAALREALSAVSSAVS